MTRARVGTGVRRHAGNASLAAPTAASNSSPVVCGSRETTSCVACAAATCRVPQVWRLAPEPLVERASDGAYFDRVLHSHLPVLSTAQHRDFELRCDCAQGSGGRAGLVTSIQLLVDDSVNSPLMRFLTVGCTFATMHIR